MSIYSNSGGNIFDEFTRRNVGRGFDDLKRDIEARRDQERELARVAAAKRRIETDEAMIRRDYAAAGIEPIYSGGLLISLSMARKLAHPGLHGDHIGDANDMVPDYGVER